jgi:hypothetical protein
MQVTFGLAKEGGVLKDVKRCFVKSFEVLLC